MEDSSNHIFSNIIINRNPGCQHLARSVAPASVGFPFIRRATPALHKGALAISRKGSHLIPRLRRLLACLLAYVIKMTPCFTTALHRVIVTDAIYCLFLEKERDRERAKESEREVRECSEKSVEQQSIGLKATPPYLPDNLLSVTSLQAYHPFVLASLFLSAITSALLPHVAYALCKQ